MKNNMNVQQMNLCELEKVSGGQFLTPEDQAAAYDLAMQETWNPYINEIKKRYYYSELEYTYRTISYEKWYANLIQYINYKMSEDLY